MSFTAAIFISYIVFIIFLLLQIFFFLGTRKYRRLFENFFKHDEPYSTFDKEMGSETVPQIKEVGAHNSDLNNLIGEINHYIRKTKGTTDFSVIQNKVERKLAMRYDQSTARLSFPTYLGLMGTFLGVFMGIAMFINGFDGAGNITDDSIKNLLFGVLVSMATSLVGLALTTWNTGKAGGARTKIEEDKNYFYDFVQTELMPSLDVSMVSALVRLHQTVDKFEPSFNRAINNFQQTFDRCTRAFGENFEKHVNAVAGAVRVMGENMDKINENIDLQEQILTAIYSEEFVEGIDRYIAAANHFKDIAQSLDKFEEARRMMLAAANESIRIQNSYNESLKIPQNIATELNSIFKRLTKFEQSLNDVSESLVNRNVLGNELLESINRQIKGIARKGDIADDFLGLANGRLKELYTRQIAAIDKMNERYSAALEGHIQGFEELIKKQTEQIQQQHQDFIKTLQEKFSVAQVREEFTNLRKLNEIDQRLKDISSKVAELGKKGKNRGGNNGYNPPIEIYTPVDETPVDEKDSWLRKMKKFVFRN